MTGPVAPRDPEKARAHFYIMRGKEICGLKQGDGKAVQFIYESDGRLANSAQIVRNITDSRILELLRYSERLPHACTQYWCVG